MDSAESEDIQLGTAGIMQPIIQEHEEHAHTGNLNKNTTHSRENTVLVLQNLGSDFLYALLNISTGL